MLKIFPAAETHKELMEHNHLLSLISTIIYSAFVMNFVDSNRMHGQLYLLACAKFSAKRHEWKINYLGVIKSMSSSEM